MLYGTVQQLFRAGIDERLLALASMAATQFDPEELDRIGGRESVGTEEYESAVLRLQRIRRYAKNVRFAYILRRTDNPDVLEFVADADSLDPDALIDLNQDGVIDEQDALVSPGNEYDISEFPEFREAAFVRPFVDPELIHDPWGTFLAGTAPIVREGESPAATRYVLGLDVDVTEFQAMRNRALVPFVVFVAFLIVVITALAMLLARMWRRQVFQLAEIDRQKDELISIVSHQLASPVASLRWSLEDMIEGEFGDLTPAQRQHAEELVRTTKGLADLTSLLLDVSRIELGRLQMKPERVDLGSFFAELVRLTTELAKQKEVTFEVELPETWPEFVCDPRLLRMAVENLLTNAVKYTDAGGKVTLTVEMQGQTLHCSVADTGIGIPRSEQQKIFSKLYRATNAQKIEGHGFGLYVAKGAIEQQGGRLWFSSEPGRGTTFFITLPSGRLA